jgi:hypothetical protein
MPAGVLVAGFSPARKGEMKMWISVYTLIEKKGEMKPETIYSMAESRLYMFSEELKVPEYETWCDWCLYIDPTKKPRQECSYCHGTGRFKTTRNPMGQFDFWELGDRVLNDELKEIEWPSKQPKIGKYTCGVDIDILTTEQLLKIDWIPNAFITPEMHYYGDGFTNREEWDERARKILKNHPEHYVVPASCHI